MTDQEQEPWQEPWPEKMYLLHPSIKTFGAMVSNPERREYVRADSIEELVKDRDLWKSRYEHHNHERLETLNLNAMQASKIGSLMNTIAKLEKKISKLEKTE